MSDTKRTVQDVRNFAEAVASRNSWVVNGEREFTDTILAGLLTNLENLGYYQCPCRVSWDERDKDRDIICPCDYSAADVKEFGHCYCALFLSPEFAASGREPGSIPERRPDELYP